MNKNIIKVPGNKNIKYISEWNEYEIPKGHCIVDKGVTGCGYTEYCLTNNLPIVLCSPRKLLLENKSDQHKGDPNIKYLKNDISDISSIHELKTIVKNHIFLCDDENLPVKLLVTYDSCHYIIDILKEMGILGEFYFIVDEFQSIFLDAFFKSEVEFDFVDYLQDCPNVIYLSATPMLDKYLEKLDTFKNLPFYELDWSETDNLDTIILQRKFTTSLSKECEKIVEKYLNNKFPFTYTSDKRIVFSKEVVFYFNSVSSITRVIKNKNLKPEQVNIICADDENNKKKLRSLSRELGYNPRKGEGFVIGKIPLKNESNKMFTFCTKTAYIGSDFYSDCASSYIFADPNIKSLALDISLDLPQIVGRQRDRENPFKNTISIFYKTTTEIQTREEFDGIQNERRNETRILLEGFQNLTPEQQIAYTKKLRDGIEVSKYSDDFVSISNKTGQPVHNHFIELAHERSWEISQKDYQDQISVTKIMEDKGYTVTEEGRYIQDDPEFLRFKYDFETASQFSEKLGIYCNYLDRYKDNLRLCGYIMFYVKNPDFQKYYSHYGTKGCKAKKFRKQDLESGLKSSLTT